jgi:hypothetical protein
MRASPDESDAIAVIMGRVNCGYGGDVVSVSVMESVGCAACGMKPSQAPSDDGTARAGRLNSQLKHRYVQEVAPYAQLPCQ